MNQYKRLQGNTFYVAYEPTYSVVHYGHITTGSVCDSGQPNLVAMNFVAFKNFLDARGIEYSQEQLNEWQNAPVDTLLPTVQIINV